MYWNRVVPSLSGKQANPDNADRHRMLRQRNHPTTYLARASNKRSEVTSQECAVLSFWVVPGMVQTPLGVEAFLLSSVVSVWV